MKNIKRAIACFQVLTNRYVLSTFFFLFFNIFILLSSKNNQLRKPGESPFDNYTSFFFFFASILFHVSNHIISVLSCFHRCYCYCCVIIITSLQECVLSSYQHSYEMGKKDKSFYFT